MSEATLGRANIIIGGALDQLDRDLDEAKKKTDAALAGFARAATAAAAVGFAALAGGLLLAVKEASDAQEISFQLTNTLENLGLAGTGVAEAIEGTSSYLQEMTRFSDDAATAAQNLFLQMGFGPERLDRLTWAAADLATAMGTDLVTASETLGRALAKPEEAAGRLKRANIVLTDEQEALIKSFTDVGDVAGAQGVILGVLRDRYGMAAEAAGQTFAGQLDRVKNRLLNVLEAVGGKLLPILQTLADKLLTWLSDPQVQAGIDNFVTGLGTWVTFIADNVLPVIFQVGGAIVEGIGQGITWLSENQGVVIGILTAIAGLFLVWAYHAAAAGIATLTALAPILVPIALIGAAVALLYTAWTQNWGGIQEKLTAAWDAIRPIFEKIIAIITAVWEGSIKPFLEQFSAKIAEWWEKIGPQVKAVWDAIWSKISTVAAAIAKFIEENMGTIKAIFEGVWGAIKGIVETAWALISGIMEVALLLFQGKWGEAWDRVKLMFSQVWEGIKGILGSMLAGLQAVFELAWAAIGPVILAAWNSITEWFATAWDNVVSFLSSAGAKVINAFDSAWSAIKLAITGAFNSVKDWFSTAWDKVTGFLSSIDLWQIGVNIMNSLWEGLKNIWDSIVDWWNSNVAPIFGATPPAGAPGGPNSMNGMSGGGRTSATGLEAALANPTEAGLATYNEWTVNIYPQQSSGRVLDDLLVAQNLVGV